jgi:hypothetical protein
MQCEIAEALAEPTLDRAAQAMAEASVDVERWPTAGLSAEDVAGGLAKTLKRAHNRFSKIGRTAKAEDFHEYRKRCKYHWYHLRLLEDIVDDEDRRHGFDKVSDLVGESHDRTVLLQAIASLPPYLRRETNTRRVAAGALGERRELRLEALRVSDALFAIEPEKIASEVRKRWPKECDAPGS